MRYKRNSGSKPVKNRKDKKGLTKVQEESVVRQLVADAVWLNELSDQEQFSKNWIQTVLLELLMQCMGKKDVITTNMFGKQIVARLFKEKGAIQVASILAKMEGHLFDVVKGSITKTVQGSVEHNHTFELIPNSERTGSVLDILEDCGAFNVPMKRLTKEDVEIISA